MRYLVPRNNQHANTNDLYTHDNILGTIATGTDTYVATYRPAPTVYQVGLRVLIKFTNANTGAATLNLNGLGAKAIKKNVSEALSTGDIESGQMFLLAYDGENFQLIGGSGAVQETFSTLSFASTVEWDQANKQTPLAKVSATTNFTLSMTNVKSGANGILKITVNTASAITITLDEDFTNKILNSEFGTYTLPSGTSGREYFIYFVCDDTVLEWVIADGVAGVVPYAQVSRITNQSISNATATAIIFTIEDVDNSNMFTLATPTRLIIPGPNTQARIATISVFAEYAANATGQRRLQLAKNGTIIPGHTHDQPAVASGASYLQTTFIIDVLGGDYLEVNTFQSSGGALNVINQRLHIRVDNI